MKKRFSKIQKLVTVVVSVVTVLASALTVLAYEPMQSSTEIAVSNLTEGDFMEFVPEGVNSTDSLFEDVDFLGYDEIFITDSDEYIVLEGYDTIYAICNHVYQNGTYYKHASNGNGGCTVYAYKAQICTKCNYLYVTDLLSTHTYVTCPHDN